MKSEKLVKTQICCWRDNRWPCVLEVTQTVSMENPVSCLILSCVCFSYIHSLGYSLLSTRYFFLFFIIPDFNVRFMSKIAQALHHMPRAYQAIFFFLTLSLCWLVGRLKRLQRETENIPWNTYSTLHVYSLQDKVYKRVSKHTVFIMYVSWQWYTQVNAKIMKIAQFSNQSSSNITKF